MYFVRWLVFTAARSPLVRSFKGYPCNIEKGLVVMEFGSEHLALITCPNPNLSLELSFCVE